MSWSCVVSCPVGRSPTQRLWSSEAPNGGLSSVLQGGISPPKGAYSDRYCAREGSVTVTLWCPRGPTGPRALGHRQVPYGLPIGTADGGSKGAVVAQPPHPKESTLSRASLSAPSEPKHFERMRGRAKRNRPRGRGRLRMARYFGILLEISINRAYISWFCYKLVKYTVFQLVFHHFSSRNIVIFNIVR